MSGSLDDGPAGAGGEERRDGGKSDADERRRTGWEKVRSGGRVAFHLVITLATIGVCVAGEVTGNLIFRAGHRLGDRVFDAVLFGFLAGNLLAWWLWVKEDAKS